jgi:DNA-binding response OmpR family regulator
VAKILLVDDEAFVREMLTEALQDEGHSVHVAINGKKAVETYDTSFDLVITDIVMPEQEGIQTILELRKLNPRVKVIAISGGGRVSSDDYLELAKKVGALETFSKPLALAEFFAAIKAAVE